MLIRKIDSRIQQYLFFLDEKKYDTVLKPHVFVAQTKDYNFQIPTDLESKKVVFPFQYGEEKINFWFFTKFSIPEEFQKDELFLFAPTGADSLVYINGEPIGALNPFHTKIKIKDSEKSSEINIAIESYAGHWYPGYHPMHKPRILLTLSKELPSYPITFPVCELVKKNRVLYDLYYDVLVLYDVANQLDDNSLRKNEILRELYYSLIQIHFVSDQKTLEIEAKEASEKLKYLLLHHNGPSVPNIFVVGHAHIDHAWLWPIRETLRKAARTFSNMVRYGEEYPEFVFIQSQPAQLELIKEKYPSIFEKVAEAYKRGQWEPNGGMLVEADTNIPSGESLIRQFLVGKALTIKFFDYYGDTLWLPDVFGYSGNLPQILKGCGIKYFVTSKINWNDTTRFPYDTFNWAGIDGSVVKSHFLTTSYEGFVSVKNITEGWNRVQHKEVQDGLIKPFGEGDGGGGTTRSDLEVMKRIGDLEGCPRTSWSKVSIALDKIFAHAHNLPTWQGELYLELHRGTYTTIANTKKYNRKIEQLFRNIEFFSVFSTPEIRSKMGFKSGIEYPQETLFNLWKEFLIHQFHDIIPGSSITQVNVEAMESYKHIVTEIENLKVKLEEFYLAESSSSLSNNTFVILNSLSWVRKTLVQLPMDVSEGISFYSNNTKQSYPCQVYKDFSNNNLLYTITNLQPMALSQLSIQEGPIDYSSPFTWINRTLETPYYTVTFTEVMQIKELFVNDDSLNYVSENGYFNTLQLAEDMPVTWDAWDIEWDTFNQKIQNLSSNHVEVIDNGPLFFQIRTKFVFSHSEIVQDIVFYSFDERIDFITKVNWNEEYKALRVIFPSTISSDTVKCEIQNGNLTRTTLKNRDHERAMFEICAHKWIILEDLQRGLALLNDSKFGHNVTKNQLGLTLLRSPKHPDAQADTGEHEFTYSLFPYKNTSITKIIQKGYELNNKPDIFKGSLTDSIRNKSFCRVSNPAIIIESIKKAESGNGIIIRFYESTGSFNKCSLIFFDKCNSIYFTNLIEENKTLISTKTSEVSLEFKAFEIKTILLE